MLKKVVHKVTTGHYRPRTLHSHALLFPYFTWKRCIVMRRLFCAMGHFLKTDEVQIGFHAVRHYGRKLNSTPEFLCQTANTKLNPNPFSVVVPKTTLADLYVIAIYHIIWHNSRQWSADGTVSVGKPVLETRAQIMEKNDVTRVYRR
jgi:hypothetical protein